MSDFKHQNPNADNEDHVEDDSKTFPMKLMEILADERYLDAISWLPHGRAFIVRNRKLFAEQVMPLHFSRKAKYSSFTRKLNRWNFVRVSSGPEIGAYYHEFFLRDKPHLAAQMFCKNARTKLAMADESVPKPTAATAAAVLEEQEKQMCPYGRPTSSGSTAQGVSSGSVPQYPNALLQSLQKDGDNKFQNMGVANNLQLLERQMQFLQEEHAQRMLLQRMAANRLQQAQLLQQQAAAGLPMPMGPMSNPALALSGFNAGAMAAASSGGMQVPNMDDSSSAAAGAGGSPMMNAEQQQAQLQRMRQMMELRNRQRQGLAPTNARASAA